MSWSEPCVNERVNAYHNFSKKIGLYRFFLHTGKLGSAWLFVAVGHQLPL